MISEMYDWVSRGRYTEKENVSDQIIDNEKSLLKSLTEAHSL